MWLMVCLVGGWLKSSLQVLLFYYVMNWEIVVEMVLLNFRRSACAGVSGGWKSSSIILCLMSL